MKFNVVNLGSLEQALRNAPGPDSLHTFVPYHSYSLGVVYTIS